jgi:putative transposase
MTHDDDARVADLLVRLGDGDTKELFRRLLETGMQELIDAELTAAIGAAPHERTDTRSNQRNGSRSRLLSTPAGDVEVRIPKVRVGSFFPSLLEPRRRVDKALWGVIMTAYTTGTSTRKVDDLVRALGCESGVSKSTVSRICAGIDEEVAVFRTRRLDHIALPYVYLDATYIKARINHRIISRAVVVATGVTANGDREVLGVDVGDSEDEVFWTAFLRGLKDRGLGGVRLVISDAHAGLKASLPRVLTGASWQRCKVHLMRNILGTVPSASKDMVAATVRTIFAQPTAEACWAQLHEVVRILEGQFPKAASILDGAEIDVLTHTAFPRAHWRKIASTNPLERINKEIKRRSNVVGIFPDDASVIRLVGAVLLDQHDDWAIAERRYLSEESMAQINVEPEEVTTTKTTALPAA